MCYSGKCPYEDYMGDCVGDTVSNGGCPAQREDPCSTALYYRRDDFFNGFTCKNVSKALLYITAVNVNKDCDTFNKVYVPGLGIKENEIKQKSERKKRW